MVKRISWKKNLPSANLKQKKKRNNTKNGLQTFLYLIVTICFYFDCFTKSQTPKQISTLMIDNSAEFSLSNHQM